MATTSPAATCAPAATRISATAPARGAVWTCSIFMASRVTSGCPASTRSPRAHQHRDDAAVQRCAHDAVAAGRLGLRRRRVAAVVDAEVAAAMLQPEPVAGADEVHAVLDPRAGEVERVRAVLDEDLVVPGRSVDGDADGDRVRSAREHRRMRRAADREPHRQRQPMRQRRDGSPTAPGDVAAGLEQQQRRQRDEPRIDARRPRAASAGAFAIQEGGRRRAGDEHRALQAARAGGRGWSARRARPGSRARRRAGGARPRGRRRGPRPWRSSSRTRARSGRRRAAHARCARRAAAATARASRDCGMKSRAGSSAQRRTSIAWPSKRTASWRERQRLAGGDAELPLDQVEAGDRLGHRVLDLQPRVHLHEVEGAVRLEQELDRAGALVGDRSHGGDALRRRGARAARASTAGDGASSISFWWRRCTEQSRSPRWTTLPWRSAKTWTSTWRTAARARSRMTSSLPNAAAGFGTGAAQRRGEGAARRRRGACRGRRRRPWP